MPAEAQVSAAVHEVAPVAEVNVPPVHGEQGVLLVVDLKVPTGHTVHPLAAPVAASYATDVPPYPAAQVHAPAAPVYAPEQAGTENNTRRERRKNKYET